MKKKQKPKPAIELTSKNIAEICSFAQKKETPFLVIDISVVEKLYDSLHNSIPDGKIYYAVKANPENEVIKTLYKKGSHFDVASRYEINQLLSLNIPTSHLSYGNTIKKIKDISYAYKKGIRYFTTDSLSDVENLATYAPGSKITFRILLPEGGKSDWPLSRKFGTDSDTVFELALTAAKLGLVPYALSFHVGSQQRDIKEWGRALKICKAICNRLKKEGVSIRGINLGGGFPSKYLQQVPETKEYGSKIMKYIEKYFGDEDIDILLEPGRSITGDAGILFSEVVLVSQKNKKSDRWVYLDVGKFGGLIETLGESIKYPIRILGKENEKEKIPVILAGPTCDSADILYEKNLYKLPKSIKTGDIAMFLSAGAYTSSYSSVNFNGFPPLKVYVYDKKNKRGIQ